MVYTEQDIRSSVGVMVLNKIDGFSGPKRPEMAKRGIIWMYFVWDKAVSPEKHLVIGLFKDKKNLKLVAVSYTHLDVYKRQGTNCLVMVLSY